MSLTDQVRPAPPPVPIHQDTSEAEVRRAHKLFDGRAGQTVTEDQLISIILDTEFPNVKPEQRGIHRVDAKGTILWLEWVGVIARTGPLEFRFADELPAWPERSFQQVQERDGELARQDFDAALARQDEVRAEERRRHNPRDAEIEQRLGALEREQAERIAELERRNAELEHALARSRERRKDGESSVARLDELKAQKAAAREGRPADAGEDELDELEQQLEDELAEPTSPPDDPGEGRSTDADQATTES